MRFLWTLPLLDATETPTLGCRWDPPLRAICTVLLDPRDPLLRSERTQSFVASPVYGRAKCLPMVGEIKT